MACGRGKAAGIYIKSQERMVGNMNQKRLGYIYLVITFIIWGSIYVVAKYALAVIPPLTVLLGRYALSVLILYVILKK